MKKIISLITLISFCFFANAMPKSTIEKVYYKTSAQLEIVGYYYQGCVNGSHVEWGVRTNHVYSEPSADCSGLGETRPPAWGECIMEYVWADNSYLEAETKCISEL